MSETNERKLASICKIDSIEEIPGRDRIALAHIKGWQAIIPKADFKAGDLVIFCEPDSLFPEKPEFEFMKNYKYRVKTIKMAGVISQGVVLHLDILHLSNDHMVSEGDDVTEELGIKKWEMPEPVIVIQRKKLSPWARFLMRFEWYRNLRGRKEYKREEFPIFLKKTDETRIQCSPELLTKDIFWHATEKLEGTSSTYFIKRHGIKPFYTYEFGVCSRNHRLPEDDGSVYWKIATSLKLEKILKSLVGDSLWYAIQGEIIGPKINRNIYGLTKPQLRVYSIITPKGRLNYHDSLELCDKIGLQHVPLLSPPSGESLKGKTVNEVLSISDGTSKIGNNDVMREGIVYRAVDGTTSFKAVSPAYLLKHDF